LERPLPKVSSHPTATVPHEIPPPLPVENKPSTIKEETIWEAAWYEPLHETNATPPVFTAFNACDMNLDQPACPMSGLLSEVSLYPTATVPHAVPTAFSAYDMNLDQPACASESPCDDQTSSVEQASSAADALGEDYASWIKKVEGMSEKEIDEQLKLAPLCDIDLTVPSTILEG
jgi:hypothetical protein